MWLKKNNIISVFVVCTALVCFVFIRHFQYNLFYDPLLLFYKQNFQNQPLPNLNITKYIASISFRFVLNSALSFAVIFAVFRDVKMLKISMLLYVVLFLVLTLALVIIIKLYSPSYAMLLFYVRRFLMQPILLILVLPAFYYHKKLTKLNT